MRHLKSGRKFSRTTDHRKWLMRNLVTSLLESGRITTTEAKAKELRRHVDRLITAAKPDDLAARRHANILPRLKERPGGYTRIIHKGPRLGDAAPMVIIEIVD